MLLGLEVPGDDWRRRTVQNNSAHIADAALARLDGECVRDLFKPQTINTYEVSAFEKGIDGSGRGDEF
jgi:hypothetical protein